MKINRRSGVINRVSVIFLLMSFMIFFSACGKEKEAGQKPAEPAAAAAEESAAGYSTEAIPENISENTSETAAENDAGGTAVQAEPVETLEEEKLFEAVFLKIGKADAIILRCGDETMVIDSGEDEDGQEVLDYLAKESVPKVNVLLITHFDKDHVGGADTVVRGIEVERVLQPAYEGTAKAYSEYMQALEEEGISPENVEETLYFDLGGASVMVEPPASYEIPDGDDEYDNDFSLIITVEYGAGRFVLTGDIEKKRIREWLAQGDVKPCDVLKVPHHGHYTSALDEMFAALSPQYAVICDSSKNPADGRTLDLLAKYSVETLETKDGDITIFCDGEQVWAQQ